MKTRPARPSPGQVAILWGTGLGPIDGDDSVLPPVGDLPGGIEVIIGGRISVMPLYAGRSPQFPAVDQINFELPANAPEGCFVPIAVNVNGIVSNYGSIAITTNGKGTDGAYCSDSNFSVEALRTAEQNGEARIGLISLTRFEITEPGDPKADRAEVIQAFFGRLPLDPALASLGPLTIPVPPPGTCTVFARSTFPEDPIADLFGGVLDAGAALDLMGPGGLARVERNGGEYEGELEEGYVQPGVFRAINGAGGEDVGGFEAESTVPTLLTLMNRDDLATISRTSELTVSWTGGDPTNELVGVFGFSDDDQAGGSFLCVDRAAAGTLPVPAAVLSSLPASGQDAGSNGLAVIGIPTREVSEFAATGLDLGLFIYFNIDGMEGVSFE